MTRLQVAAASRVGALFPKFRSQAVPRGGELAPRTVLLV